MAKYAWIGLIVALVGMGVGLNRWWNDASALAGQPPAQQQSSPDSSKEQGNDSLDEQTAVAPEPEEVGSPLEELAWLVGSWVDRGEQSTITTTVRWTKNRTFLTRSFRVVTDGEVSLEGTQVIAWDPVQQHIRSWTFDSEGGFGEGIWLRDGVQWLVKKKFTLPQGKRASAINVITYVDDNTFRWKSINREIEGELLPNVPETTVIRQVTADEKTDRENRQPDSGEQQEQNNEKEGAKQ